MLILRALLTCAVVAMHAICYDMSADAEMLHVLLTCDCGVNVVAGAVYV